jgi:hypothetical protein
VTAAVTTGQQQGNATPQEAPQQPAQAHFVQRQHWQKNSMEPQQAPG